MIDKATSANANGVGQPTSEALLAAVCDSVAALERIFTLCEAYQNQDIEGQDPEDTAEACDLVINQICEIACVEHARLSWVKPQN